MILTRSTRLFQPQGPVELSPEFGDAVAFVPGAVNPMFATRTTRVLTTEGRAERGSAATGGVSPSTASYIAFPESSRTFLGNKPHWAFIAGNIANTSANSWILGAGQPSANAGILLSYLASTGRLEFATRFGGTWYSSTAPVTLSANRDFEAGYSIDADGTLRLYWDGLEVLVKTGVGATTPTPNLPPTAGMAYASQANNNLYGNSSSIAFAAVGQSAYSDRMGARIAANPWQLFRPVQRRIYFDMWSGGGGTSTVTSDLLSIYNIRGAVAADSSHDYSVRGEVAATIGAAYDIRGSVFENLGASYDVRGSAAANLGASYDVRGSAITDLSASYLIRGAAGADSDVSYAVRGAVHATASPAYDIRGSVTSDLSAAYDILSATSVVADSACAYSIRGTTYATTSPAYDILGTAVSDLPAAYDIRSATFADLSAAYAVEAGVASVYADLTTSYFVDGAVHSGGLSPSDLAAIRVELAPELAAIFQIQTKVDAAL